jgi:predicted AlkP superfamily phosphohydrolase/phosphomutase
MFDREELNRNYEMALKEIFEKVDKVIGELEDINTEYASWDAWDKTKIIDSALGALQKGFMKELEEKYS